MKAIRFFLLLLLGSPLLAQTTAVTASVVDPSGTAWSPATCTAAWIGSGRPVDLNGNPFSTHPSCSVNGSGVMSVTVEDVAYIVPPASTWKFCVTPSVSQAQTYCVIVPATGASQSISTQIQAVLISPVVSGGPLAAAYNDAEVPAVGGNQYFRVTDSTFRCYTTSWGSCGTAVASGVSSINTVQGAFTFSGSGVSCTGTTCTFSGGGGSGTVTSFSSGNLSPLFTSSVATPTSTPALTFTISSAAQNSVLAGPASGGAGAPSYQTAPTISAANMTNFPTLNQNTTGYAAGLAGGALGSAPYQTAANTTGFLASPVTSGHTFVYAWQPVGSVIAPAALDLGTYLASPPSIGSTTPAPGSFSTLIAGTSLTLSAITGSTQCLHVNTSGLVSGTGSDCGAGGGGITIQTNGVNNSSQTAINFINSTVNAAGLTVTASNPSTSSEKFEITGTATNATNATNVATTATTTNATYYLAILPATSGNQAVNLAVNFTYNPSTGALALPGSLALGSSPPTACGTATGCFASTEAAVAGTPTASQDYCRADSAAHGFKCSLNAGSEFTSAMNFPATGAQTAVPTGPTTSTASHIVIYTNTSGGQADSGITAPAAAGNATMTQTIASGSALALGTTAIASGACGTAATATATGAATTDVVGWSPSADWSAITGYSGTSGQVTLYVWATANTVNAKQCNWTSSSITPAAASINWKIAR